jgi:hypothetical protein
MTDAQETALAGIRTKLHRANSQRLRRIAVSLGPFVPTSEVERVQSTS